MDGNRAESNDEQAKVLVHRLEDVEAQWLLSVASMNYGLHMILTNITRIAQFALLDTILAIE